MFYLIPYVQNIIISTCIQYKEITNEIAYILFSYPVFEIYYAFNTYSTCQFGPATFHVLSSHRRLMATIYLAVQS